MCATRTGKPARKPAAGRAASRAKLMPSRTKASVASTKAAALSAPDKPLETVSQSRAKKTKAEAATKRSAAGTSPAGKTRAAVAARKATIAATTRYVDDAPVILDENDDAAKAGLSRQRTRRTTVRRKDQPSPRIKRTAVERLDDPPPASGAVLIERVTRCARGDDRRRFRAARGSRRSRAAVMVAVAQTAGVEQRRGGAGVFRRRP